MVAIMPLLRLVYQFSQRQRRIIYIILTPLEYITAFLDFFYPKDNKTVMFGSDNGEFVSGSPKVLFEYMKKNHPEYKIFFYSPFMKLKTLEKVKYVLTCAPIFFRAKFLVSNQSSKDFFPFAWSTKKIFVNTWHGTPLKAMFFSDHDASNSSLRTVLRMNTKTSAFLVASKLEATLIARCFLIDSKKFCYLGHPRNDILYRNGGSSPKRLPEIIRNIPEYEKIILYCPTYRRDAPTLFFPFEDFDLENLAHFLEKNKLIILARTHIYNRASAMNFFSKRIIPFGFDVYNDVNSILPKVDILITDYSSIYIDYLLLDRPCIFIPYDIENYKKKRGLLLDYDSWAAGEKVVTHKELIRAIAAVLSGKDVYKNKRQALRRQFHRYQTENSCEKVFQLINRWHTDGM
jgi:CDP-glycerol glycerophosphotransferase (TagB/SpsB family)